MFFNKWKELYEEAQEEIEELEESIEELEEVIEELEEEIEDLEETVGTQKQKIVQWNKAYKSLERKHKLELNNLVEQQLITSFPKDTKLTKLLSEKLDSESALLGEVKGKNAKIQELNRLVKKQAVLLDENTEKDIIKITQLNAQMEALVIEMKLRLDIVETSASLKTVQEYLQDNSRIFMFHELINLIDDNTDFNLLFDLFNKMNLQAIPTLSTNKITLTTLRQTQNLLENKLEDLDKLMSECSLDSIFYDYTLERYFKLTRKDSGYSIDTLVTFEDTSEILIPETFKGTNIVELSENLFYNYKSLKKLIVEAKVEVIPENFCRNSSVDYVMLLDTIKSFGAGAFAYTMLETMVLPNNLKVLTYGVFTDCTKLNILICNEELEHIEPWACSGCTMLTEVIISKNVVTIAETAFTKSPNLVFKCYAGSYAQQWARERGFTVKNAEEDD